MSNLTFNISDGMPDEIPDEVAFNYAAMLLLTVLISVIAAVGIVGNATVMYIVFRHKDMHTVINYSFANLALTDLTLLVLDAIPTAG